jgi:hypothetical protein
MPLLLALVLAVTTPTPPAARDQTGWMRPDAFHLVIGMSRTQVLQSLDSWAPKQGKDRNELVVDYSGERAMTLEFHDERLRSIRFELFVFLPEIAKVFDQKKAYLLKTFGEPRLATRSVLIYDGQLPNVMVVVSDDPTSDQGKKGLGILAVRYYDPR